MNDIIRKKHRYKITQGPDGRWRTNVMIDGKRTLIVRVNRQDLERYLAEFYAVKNAAEITMRELYPDWIAYKALHVSEPTVNRIQATWRQFYDNSDIVDRPIREIKKVELDTWIHTIIREHELNRKAYNNFVTILNGLLDYAVDLDIVAHNVKRDIRIGRVLYPDKHRKDSEQVFSAAEFSQLKKMCMQDFANRTYPKHRLIPLAVIFMFYSGLRVGEITALQYRDIDSDTITVQRMYREETGEIIDDTKGAFGVRTVPLIQDASDLILLTKETQRSAGVRTDYIFSMTRDPVPYDGVRKAFYKYSKRLQTAPKSSHKARKTFVSALIDEGVNISTVQQWAGHKKKTTTLENYTFDRGTDAEKRQLMERALTDQNTSKSPPK